MAFFWFTAVDTTAFKLQALRKYPDKMVEAFQEKPNLLPIFKHPGFWFSPAEQAMITLVITSLRLQSTKKKTFKPVHRPVCSICRLRRQIIDSTPKMKKLVKKIQNSIGHAATDWITYPGKPEV